MRVYIAGPMTGYVNHNFDAFNSAATRLRDLGYAVVNPAEMDEGMTAEELSTTPHEVFMRRDIAALIECEAIYLLPGWRHSKGATLEAAVAKGCGIVEIRDPDTELWRSFEGDPLEEADAFYDIDYVVDESLPPYSLVIDGKHFTVTPGDCNGLRGSECSAGQHVEGAADTVVHLPDEDEMVERIERHSRPRPGDKFPDVAYVRDMTGVTAAEAMSPFEVAEHVNDLYDGRGDK